MKVRRINGEEDMEVINAWLIARGEPSNLVEDMPKIGYIVEHENDYLGAGYLRAVEGDIGIMEGLVTNPAADSALRHVAIESIVTTIVERAKDLGVICILSWTSEPSILARSKKHGFREPKTTLIVKDMADSAFQLQ